MWDEPYDLAALAGDEEEARVLVTVVPSARDWALVRERGWYRIPTKRAPAQLSAQYLAFYHTRAVEELRWRIAYYAPVRGYQVVRRVDLLPDEADHPRAADPYYRIELGPLIALPRAIPSRALRRITFIPTTLGRLLAAREVNDLWDRETARDRLWRALRERRVDAEHAVYLRERGQEYVVDVAVHHPPRSLAVLCVEPPHLAAAGAGPAHPPAELLQRQGWERLELPAAEVMAHPRRCAEAILRRLAEGAGPVAAQPGA